MKLLEEMMTPKAAIVFVIIVKLMMASSITISLGSVVLSIK